MSPPKLEPQFTTNPGAGHTQPCLHFIKPGFLANTSTSELYTFDSTFVINVLFKAEILLLISL